MANQCLAISNLPIYGLEMWNDPPHGLLGRTGLLGRLLAIAVLNSATLRGFVTVLSAVSCGSRGCGAFRLFSFKKQFNLPHGEREIIFCLHGLLLRPVDLTDHGGTQTGP